MVDLNRLSRNPYRIIRFSRFREEEIIKRGLAKLPNYELQRKLYEDLTVLPLRNLKSNSIYTNMYIGPAILEYLPNRRSKVFFILRDPRDIVISWYYSTKYSHHLTENIDKSRKVLNNLEFNEGILYSIDIISEFGLFNGIRAWIEHGEAKNCKIFFYEDLVANYESFMKDLFSYLEFNIGSSDFKDILERHSFSKISNGRKPGEIDVRSHYRSASINEWKKVFSKEIIEYFKLKSNSLDELYEKYYIKYR